MYEIRIHGRGGQGAVTTSEILAIAAFHDGKQSQAFPVFGVERRGAPVTAFTRIDDNFINKRSQIYKPTHVIILEPSLIKAVDVTKGLSEGGRILVNTSKNPRDLGIKGKYTVCTMDATSIATEVFGKPIINTTILGAFAKASGLVTLDSLKKAIDQKFTGKIAELNKTVVEKASQCEIKEENLAEGEFQQESTEVCAAAECEVPKINKAAVIYEPGNSTKNHTGGWREGTKPVRDPEKCIKCHQCWMFCPDNAINEEIETNYDYCKGCGICAEVCPVKCIKMEKEEK